MDMSINLTLVVQICNFILAYFLISRFFLQPGYRSVRIDDERLHQIRSQITARQELIAHKQAHKRTRWELFRNYFYKQKPDIHEELKVAHPFKTGIDVPKLSQNELARLSKEVLESIKDRI